MSFQLDVKPGAEPWAPDQRAIGALSRYFAALPTGTIVEMWPRAKIIEATGTRLPDHAFRAVTRGPRSIILVDPTETPTSISWLIGHELAHQLVRRSPTIRAAMDDAHAADQGLTPASDRFHEVDAEERFCDGIATRLTGRRLDRAWWRSQTGPVHIPETYGSLFVTSWHRTC